MPEVPPTTSYVSSILDSPFHFYEKFSAIRGSMDRGFHRRLSFFFSREIHPNPPGYRLDLSGEFR
jgi:hypothetical protein